MAVFDCTYSDDKLSHLCVLKTVLLFFKSVRQLLLQYERWKVWLLGNSFHLNGKAEVTPAPGTGGEVRCPGSSVG